MITQTQAQQLIGQKLRTTDGDKVGTIGQVYLGDQTGQPEWATVNTGLFGTNESFVPLAEATISDNDLVVPYSKSQIKDAPNIDETGHLSPAEERELYAYYNVSYAGETSYEGTGTARTEYAGTDRDVSDVTDRSTTGNAGTTGTGHDTSGRTTDQAMTRSEEQLNVDTERVQTGKARLRKWVETENVQVDVPVRKEKAVVVTEPVTDANRDAAYSGQDITEDEHEIVLNAERPVVSKDTVAQERVRLDTEVEESVETVGGEVRKERIDVDGDGVRDTRR